MGSNVESKDRAASKGQKAVHCSCDSNFHLMVNTHAEEALRYKPEGRGIDSRWCHWNFSLT
jgi:hypothetical protein